MKMTNPVLPSLRDIHLPPERGWWPPAPGWWLLVALVVGVSVWWVVRRWRVRRRVRARERVLAQFDAALAAVDAPPAKLAAASEMLRRAARVHDAAAATFAGDAWLQFLDGLDVGKPFSQGAGRALIDGAFRPRLDDDISPAIALARARFVELCAGGDLESGHA